LFAMVSVPPGSTMMVDEEPIDAEPARVRLPPAWMSSVQPGQLRFMPMIGLGMALLMMSVVGVGLRSWATSPGAQPGNPPGGVQTAAEVSVKNPIGGGALEVTL